jgi:hypothetical protein
MIAASNEEKLVAIPRKSKTLLEPLWHKGKSRIQPRNMRLKPGGMANRREERLW